MSVAPVAENIVGMISHFFVTNRPLSLIILVAMIAFGGLAFVLMPKQYNPEIVRPAFAIVVPYHGATTEQALERVVFELHEKITTVPGVDELYFTVRDGAVIESTVIFTVGYDATKAKVDLLAQLEQHEYLARGFISPPHILEINPETIPVLHLVFQSDTLGIAALRSEVVRLSQAVAGVVGVSEVTVGGGYTDALVVSLDPARLAAAGLTTAEIQAVVSQQQSRYVLPGLSSGAHQLELVFDGQASSVDEMGLLSVAPGVALRDVADVYVGTAGSRTYVQDMYADTLREVVTLSVAKVEGASAPRVTAAFLDALDAALAANLTTDISYRVVGDDGATATAEINGLMTNLVTSIAIVAVVLLLFLSARAALVVLIAIPTTLVLVFGIGWLFDQTINRITLFALILSLGLLVDSAIVVVENIYAHLRDWQATASGVPRERAVAGAVHEIGVGLILSTVTSVIVFLPMFFITGMMGPYMGPIAFFVPVALVVSLLVAVVVVPFVAAHVLQPDATPGRFGRYTNAVVTYVTEYYALLLSRILAVRSYQRWLLRGALGLFVVSLLLPAFALVHFQMLPKADRDQFYLYLDLPEDTAADTTATMAARVSAIVSTDPAVESVQQFVGTAPLLDFNGLFKGAPSRTQLYQATLRVNLSPTNTRARSSTDIVSDIRAELTRLEPQLATQTRLLEDPPGPPVQATLVAKFSGQAAARTAAAETFMTHLRSVTGVVDVADSLAAPVSRVRYAYDAMAGDTLSVSPSEVASTLRLLGEPLAVGEYLAGETPEYAPIVLTTDTGTQSAQATLGSLTVRSQSTGELVPLTAVLTTEIELRPPVVQLEGATPVTYVTAEVADRSIVYVTIELMYALISGALPGYTVTDWNLFALQLANPDGTPLTLTWGGEWEMTLENFRDLGLAMLVALALVYAVLAAQYQRFDVPGYILVTVPLGLIGILWGFFVLDTWFGIYLTATALIGFIALIGIVVNNAIIYLEYVAQAEQAGYPLPEALVAAGRARLRPIVLTSLTTVLGSLTIAGDPVWSGLAWAIVFGLSLSTILTLIVYPTLLVYFRNNPSN
jgi:multidrug efflux pump subunit AcrB